MITKNKFFRLIGIIGIVILTTLIVALLYIWFAWDTREIRTIKWPMTRKISKYCDNNYTERKKCPLVLCTLKDLCVNAPSNIGISPDCYTCNSRW